jgi:hypothetical protein
VYRTCTISVPFQRKLPKKSRAISTLRGSRAARAKDHALQALRRAAKGSVEEYGHLSACDATVGAFDAKNGVPCGPAAQTIRLGLIWKEKRRFQCRDGSVTSLTRA